MSQKHRIINNMRYHLSPWCHILPKKKWWLGPKKVPRMSQKHWILYNTGCFCHLGVISRDESWKSPKDVLMRRPATYFATGLNWLASTNLSKTLNYIQYKVLFVIQVPYHAIRVINEPWKSTKDVLMRRPATYFATVLNWLASTNLSKTLN